jgi:hypothetical protein
VEGSSRGVICPAFAWRDWGNHDKPQSRQTVSEPRSEPGTSRIRSRNANHSTTTLGFSCFKRLTDTKHWPSYQFIRSCTEVSDILWHNCNTVRVIHHTVHACYVSNWNNLRNKIHHMLEQKYSKLSIKSTYFHPSGFIPELVRSFKTHCHFLQLLLTLLCLNNSSAALFHEECKLLKAQKDS